MELHFGMGWMRFDHSKSGLLAADWTCFLDEVFNPHVTSFRPTCFGLKATAAQMALVKKGGIEPGHLAMAARSNQKLLLECDRVETS